MIKKKQESQKYQWFFTYNNYSESEPIRLKLLFNRICKWYIFQEEKGEKTNTKHLQGSISLKTKARLTELKKIGKEIHWEPTRNVEGANKYCLKEESRCGEQWSHLPKKAFIRTKSKFDEITPRKEIIDIIEQEPDNRTINWIWSEEGKVGKTSTAAYIEHNYENVCVANGKAGDIKNQVITHLKEHELDIMLITIPRSAENYLGGLYGVLEEIKDGLIYSGKYEGGFANIEHPHVIVMSNFEPKYEMMSEDRWKVVNVDA